MLSLECATVFLALSTQMISHAQKHGFRHQNKASSSSDQTVIWWKQPIFPLLEMALNLVLSTASSALFLAFRIIFRFWKYF